MKQKKFTKQDFILFEDAVYSYLAWFELAEWRVEILHVKKQDVFARCTYDCEAKIACFTLAKKVKYDFGLMDIKKLAAHEVLHLLFADLINASSLLSNASHPIVISHEHEVINKLVGILEHRELESKESACQ